jgi:hypothetical protein
VLKYPNDCETGIVCVSKKNDLKKAQITLGWREWVSLPALGLDQIKAKVDTGARTSTLHAFRISEFEADGRQKVEFLVHPNQRDHETVVKCTADIVDRRSVRDSGGHSERRWVIKTPLLLGGRTWPIEMTLTERDNMLFRMLLGRTAMAGIAIVDPKKSYLASKRPQHGKE